MTTHDHTQKSAVAPAKTRVVVNETAVPAPRGGEMTAEQLQRAYGNRATRLIIQRKMTVGPVGDKYEQEADAVAKQVVQSINTPTAPPLQRQDEDDELQMKPYPSIISSPTPLTLQRHGKHEELQMTPISTVQRHEEDEEVQMKPISTLQRQEEEEDVQMKSSSTMDGGELSSDIEGKIQSAKGGGQPLAPDTQSKMGQAFNADFSNVKVHTGAQSDTLNRSISARAFTTGNDIFFRDGEYNPDNSGGQELLAHELTHVVQQGGANSSIHRHFMAIPGYDEEEPTLQRTPVSNISTASQIIQRLEADVSIPLLKQEDLLELTDFTPATRSGMFDVQVFPKTGQMKVIVKLHLDLFAYDDKRWTEEEATTWIEKLQTGIATTWNDKVRMNLLPPNATEPEMVITPTFIVQASYTMGDPVAKPDAPITTEEQAAQLAGHGAPRTGGDLENASRDKAHFDVMTNRSSAAELRSAKREIGSSHPEYGRLDRAGKEANVNSSSITEKSLGQGPGGRQQGIATLQYADNEFMSHNEFFVEQIGLSEKNMYKKLLGTEGIGINFKWKATGTGKIGERSTVKLNTFVSRWKSLYPRPVLKWPLILRGGSKGKREKVRNFLQEQGMDNEFVLQSASGGLTLKYDNDHQATAQDDIGSQLTAAHEFGHMLGLPDDYVGLTRNTKHRMDGYTFKDEEAGLDISPDTEMNTMFNPGASSQVPFIDQKQEAMMDLYAKANVPVPTTFGLKHDTIMGSGDKFLPHHFVTVWDALTKATADYTEHGWWKIETL